MLHSKVLSWTDGCKITGEGETMKRYNLVKSKIKAKGFDGRLAKTVDAWLDVKNTKSMEWRSRAVKAGRSR